MEIENYKLFGLINMNQKYLKRNQHSRDSAKVNLNFWIINEFNINKNSGGLRVYDEPAPKSLPFAKYNRNTEDIVNFLQTKKI